MSDPQFVAAVRAQRLDTVFSSFMQSNHIATQYFASRVPVVICHLRHREPKNYSFYNFLDGGGAQAGIKDQNI